MKLKNIIIGLTALITLIPFASADYLPIQAYATDTIAGYSSLLKTSLIEPNQDIRFVIERSDGTVIKLPATADLDGVAKTDLYGHQTKLSGSYKVAVVYPNGSVSSPQSSFTVYPDKVSSSQSSLHSTLQMLEAGSDATYVIVTLYDEYRNPIPDHRVKLISSRSEDEIEVLSNGVSDKDGRANFKIKSSSAGISVYTAMDVTMNQLLDDREEIVFYAPAKAKINPFSASLLSANIGGDSTTLPGPVSTFEITGLPATAKVNEQLSLTVTAKDKNKNIAKNYTGTILISAPDDDNATLPSSGQYTFKASDQGKFTFSLSLQFSKTGKQTIQVLDKSNFKIIGEKTIQIVAKDSVSSATTTTSSSLAIKSPANGSKLGSSLIILTGKGDANIDLKIFDNNTQIGTSQTDGDGFFSYQAKNLSSGSHAFYVMSNKGEISKSITITVDTVSPVLNSFKMDTSGSVKPGTKVEITIQSEKNLSTAKVSIQGAQQDMTESTSEPGTYTATVTAPTNDGSFPIDITLADSLSNKAVFSKKGTITVETPKPTNPPKVEGLTGVAGDKSISLTWKAVTGHAQTIKNYRIYYGIKVDNLDKKVDTKDSTVKYDLTGLTNKTQYFVAVKAVDSKDLESKTSSTTIAATPVAPDLCANVSCGSNGTCGSSTGQCTCNTGWSGTTCNVADPIISTPVVTATPVVTTTNQLQATSYNSSVILSWQPFSNVQAYYYKVFIGFTPGKYSDYYLTENNTTSAKIQDLMNNINYYFAVVALDITGKQISMLSNEATAIPTGSGFKLAAPTQNLYTQPTTTYDLSATTNTAITQYQTTQKAVKTKTGPETIWVILISIIFAGLFFRYKRVIV